MSSRNRSRHHASHAEEEEEEVEGDDVEDDTPSQADPSSQPANGSQRRRRHRGAYEQLQRNQKRGHRRHHRHHRSKKSPSATDAANLAAIATVMAMPSQMPLQGATGDPVDNLPLAPLTPLPPFQTHAQILAEAAAVSGAVAARNDHTWSNPQTPPSPGHAAAAQSSTAEPTMSLMSFEDPAILAAAAAAAAAASSQMDTRADDNGGSPSQAETFDQGLLDTFEQLTNAAPPPVVPAIAAPAVAAATTPVVTKAVPAALAAAKDDDEEKKITPATVPTHPSSSSSAASCSSSSSSSSASVSAVVSGMSALGLNRGKPPLVRLTLMQAVAQRVGIAYGLSDRLTSFRDVANFSFDPQLLKADAQEAREFKAFSDIQYTKTLFEGAEPAISEEVDAVYRAYLKFKKDEQKAEEEAIRAVRLEVAKQQAKDDLAKREAASMAAAAVATDDEGEQDTASAKSSSSSSSSSSESKKRMRQDPSSDKPASVSSSKAQKTATGDDATNKRATGHGGDGNGDGGILTERKYAEVAAAAAESEPEADARTESEDDDDDVHIDEDRSKLSLSSSSSASSSSSSSSSAAAKPKAKAKAKPKPKAKDKPKDKAKTEDKPKTDERPKDADDGTPVENAHYCLAPDAPPGKKLRVKFESGNPNFFVYGIKSSVAVQYMGNDFTCIHDGLEKADGKGNQSGALHGFQRTRDGFDVLKFDDEKARLAYSRKEAGAAEPSVVSFANLSLEGKKEALQLLFEIEAECSKKMPGLCAIDAYGLAHDETVKLDLSYQCGRDLDWTTITVSCDTGLLSPAMRALHLKPDMKRIRELCDEALEDADSTGKKCQPAEFVRLPLNQLTNEERRRRNIWAVKSVKNNIYRFKQLNKASLIKAGELQNEMHEILKAFYPKPRKI